MPSPRLYHRYLEKDVSMSRTTITSVHVEPFNIPLPEPFPIATGVLSAAQNVLVTLMLDDGTIGYGECAPFPPVTGESQATALAATGECATLLEGKDVAQWRALSKLIRSVFYAQKSVCTGMEMAMLDALTRSLHVPLYVFFGGAGSFVETDISVAMVSPEHAYELAQDAVARGLSRIKIKVGGDVAEDVARVEAIYRAAPALGLTLDANQGYTPGNALRCLLELEQRHIVPLMMEQPVHKDDFEGLRYVTQHTPIPIAADESATNSAEVMRLLTAGAVNVINIKLQKSGLVDALTIAAICHTTKTPLMIGSMAESCIGTSASAHFAAGVGGFSYIDLDMPMLLLDDPFAGGYEQRGGIYDLSGIESGMGVEKKSKPPDAGA